MPDAVGWLTEPYAFEFMRRALLASLLLGVIAPLVGVWIVLRRLAYLGDAMSHATLSGVAVAYLAGWSITVGAIAAGLLMAALMALLAGHPRLREDSIIATVSVALFAAAIILISSQDSIGVYLDHFLFGSITTVTPADLTLNAVLGALALIGLLAVFEDLRSASFDPLHAELVGIRVGALRYALYATLAVTVVLALQTVGILMAVALLVIPAAAARLWTRTLAAMSALAVAFGVAACLAGLTVSFHAASAPGATIAIVAVALLAASFAATLPRRGRRPAAHQADLQPTKAA